jgi:hypothetical protein
LNALEKTAGKFMTLKKGSPLSALFDNKVEEFYGNRLASAFSRSSILRSKTLNVLFILWLAAGGEA